jgi:chorismate-pyruvate lyase
MRAVTVYRVDYGRKTKDPIGTVMEKRKTERAHNYHDLLAADTEALRVGYGGRPPYRHRRVRHARETILPERTMDCVAG